MAFAPTRSGKGVGLVVPTLLSWTGSTVIHDIKGENWQLTAGWRLPESVLMDWNHFSRERQSSSRAATVIAVSR